MSLFSRREKKPPTPEMKLPKNPVFCSECERFLRDYGNVEESKCARTGDLEERNPIFRPYKRVNMELCVVKNANNDCPDFEEVVHYDEL